jgi:hypothetical protein
VVERELVEDLEGFETTTVGDEEVIVEVAGDDVAADPDRGESGARRWCSTAAAAATVVAAEPARSRAERPACSADLPGAPVRLQLRTSSRLDPG